MMDVSDTAHGNERNVVKYPTDDWINTRVVDLVHVGLLQVVVAALPAHGVPENDESKYAKTGSAAPVNEGVTKEEVLDNFVMLDGANYVRV
jgi:hypothetical protein